MINEIETNLELEYIKKNLFETANKLRLSLPEKFRESNRDKITRTKQVKELYNLVVSDTDLKEKNKEIIKEIEILASIRKHIKESKVVAVDVNSSESLLAHSPTSSSASVSATISPSAGSSSASASFSESVSTGGAGSKRSHRSSASTDEQKEALEELQELHQDGQFCTTLLSLKSREARGMRRRKRTKFLSPNENACTGGAANTNYDEISRSN